ncbi:MAG TPA: condensation domain-containing protein, partial [Pseudonocardiaceae bacterium]|nr:condensation domain-containing protein [Pseudonocardiaceae bacterium]
MIPLSFAQQRLWFMEQVADGSANYHVPIALRLRGSLDEAALRTALADVVRRHETLRTIYPAQDGQPHQVVLTDVRVPWRVRPTTADRLTAELV